MKSKVVKELLDNLHQLNTDDLEHLRFIIFHELEERKEREDVDFYIR